MKHEPFIEMTPEDVPAAQNTHYILKWRDLFWNAAKQWVVHKDARSGAALAYYSIFSLGPIIVIAIAIAGLMFGQEAARGEASSALKALIGETGATAVNTLLASVRWPGDGIGASLLGTGTLLFASIGVVVQLKDAFNTVWEVEELPGAGLWRYARQYILSLVGVFILGFFLLASMIVTAALAVGGKYFGSQLPEDILQLTGFSVSFAVFSLLFAMMFKWLPDTNVEWRDVGLGAIVTAVLFEIGKFLLGVYIGRHILESTYGAASSIVIVPLWIYYSAQIILLGAEITNVFAKQFGSLKDKTGGQLPNNSGL
eukprot:gene7700-7761_t